MKRSIEFIEVKFAGKLRRIALLVYEKRFEELSSAHLELRGSRHSRSRYRPILDPDVTMYLDVRKFAGERNTLPLGLARLTRLACAGISLDPIASQLLGVFERDPNHAGALLDLSVIDQLNGNLEAGLTRQAMALTRQRLFHSTCCGAKPRLRLLAFVTAADIGANTPLEFLLEGSDIALTTVFVMRDRPLPKDLPDHDIAFVAVAGTERNRAVLAELDEMLSWWPAPVVNLPNRISNLERNELALNLNLVPNLHVPSIASVRRDELQAVAAGEKLSRFLPGHAFPVVIKPSTVSVSQNFAKIEDEIGLGFYLTERPESCFVISPFVDYQSSDGQFRKFRILFINQRPYACHMAISEAWDTHYFDARMDSSPTKRVEEASFFANFENDFAIRHQTALSALCEQVGLPYFAIDCAETPSGELVVFRADHTLLVHDMDPVDVFPYKPAQMRKIFTAFAAFLHQAAKNSRKEMTGPAGL